MSYVRQARRRTGPSEKCRSRRRCPLATALEPVRDRFCRGIRGCAVRGFVPRQQNIRIDLDGNGEQRQHKNDRYGSHLRIDRAGLRPNRSASANVFVIGRLRGSRRIAYNGGNSRRLLSTLIEACASQRRRLAISNEEQPDV
jgi:hypothetical protein